MSRFAQIYTTALKWILVSLLACLLAIMGAQIVFRYGLNSSLIWAEESCRYLLIWASFIGIALAYERGEIAAVELLRDVLSRKAGLALSIIVNLAGAGLCAVLVYYGLRYASLAGTQPVPALRFIFTDLFGSEAGAPAMFWVYLALPVGMALLGLRLLVDVVAYARMFRTGDHARDLRGTHTAEVRS